MTTTEPTPEAVADMDSLREEVARLRRWKTEASEVMIGLQDLGRALDIPLGQRITGTLAAEIAARLTAKVARVEALLTPTVVVDTVNPDHPPRELHPFHIKARDLREALEGDS